MFKWNKKLPVATAKLVSKNQQRLPISAVIAFFLISFSFLALLVFYFFQIAQEAMLLVERTAELASRAEIDASLKEQAIKGVESVVETIRSRLDSELALRFPNQQITIATIYSQFHAIFRGGSSVDANQSLLGEFPNVAKLLQSLKKGNFSQLMNWSLLQQAFIESKSFFMDTLLGVFHLDPSMLLGAFQNAMAILNQFVSVKLILDFLYLTVFPIVNLLASGMKIWYMQSDRQVPAGTLSVYCVLLDLESERASRVLERTDAAA